MKPHPPVLEEQNLATTPPEKSPEYWYFSWKTVFELTLVLNSISIAAAAAAAAAAAKSPQ